MTLRIVAVGLVVLTALCVLLVSEISTASVAVHRTYYHRTDDRVPTAVVYRIDPAQSKFMAHASRGGLAWFKGHSHNLAVRNFGGIAKLDLQSLNPASLEMSIRADSLEETDPVFTQEQKQIINKELDEIVLEAAKYPEITFKSTSVTGSLTSAPTLNVLITGDLTLHGVTRRITIPATVTLGGDSFRAVGKFEIDRKDFNVRATDAFHGLVRVKRDVKFDFDIIAKKQ